MLSNVMIFGQLFNVKWFITVTFNAIKTTKKL